MPVVSKTNIKEYKDSFSNEKFDFRNHPNITFFVYVSNFTWPIKIQVRSDFQSHTCKDGEISVMETKFANLSLAVNEMYKINIALPLPYLCYGVPCAYHKEDYRLKSLMRKFLSTFESKLTCNRFGNYTCIHFFIEDLPLKSL